MMERLLYLTASRPDIMLSVCPCDRYQANPKEMLLSTVKHIMRYLVSMPHLGLWYPKSNTCSLLGYLHANFTGSGINRKSTSGRCQFLGHPLVS